MPLARRGDPEARALLRAPSFPSVFSYLFEWDREFLMWHDRERAPTWVDWHAWATLMRRSLTPLDMRLLRRIHTARQQVAARAYASPDPSSDGSTDD